MKTPSATVPNHLSAQAMPIGWRWAPWWVLAYVAFWPAARVSEAILSLGALVATYLLVKTRLRTGPVLLSQPAWALTCVLFFAYWLPQLLSVVDAIEPVAALKKTLANLRYLPFLWLVAIAVATAKSRRVVFTGLALLMGIWALDVLLEGIFKMPTSVLYTGMDGMYEAIRGKAMCAGQEARGSGRVNGIFGTCNPVLGIVLASFSPFVLYVAQRRFGVAGWLVAMLILAAAIVLTGARAGWLSYALVVLLSGWYVLGIKRLLLLAAATAAVLVGLVMSYPPVSERVQRSAAVLQGDMQGVDAALSGRLRIWQAAACMIAEHPVNGVGVRDFRNAWDDCDPAPGAVVAWGEGPALHAHHWLLEVLSETGVLGLLCWLAGIAMAWRAWLFASAQARQRAQPAMQALLVTVFPFNTHLAFYSAFWGGVFLLLAALYAGSLLARDAQPLPDDSTH